MSVEIQEILKNIMKQEDCSPVFALYLLIKAQDVVRSEEDVHTI